MTPVCPSKEIEAALTMGLNETSDLHGKDLACSLASLLSAVKSMYMEFERAGPEGTCMS